jgi:hypothetical protein
MEIDSGFLGHGVNPLGLQGFDRFGGEAQLNPALALGPPHPFFLQVSFLQALGATVGVGDAKGVVGFFPSKFTVTAHGKTPEMMAN